MKKEKEILKMSRRRSPTEYELQKISKYMNNCYTSTRKLCKKCFVIMGVLGIILLLSYERNGVFSIILGVLSLLGAISARRYIKQIYQEMKVIQSGNFLVVDGYVGKIASNMSTPGVSNVMFVSNEEQEWDGWFGARHEDLHVGLPLLLMYVSPDKIKRGICRVFTPYMLTEEGIKRYMI